MKKHYTKQELLDFAFKVLSEDFNNSVDVFKIFKEWDNEDKGGFLYKDPLKDKPEIVTASDKVSIGYSDQLVFWYYDGDEEDAVVCVGLGYYRTDGRWEHTEADKFIWCDRVFKWMPV